VNRIWNPTSNEDETGGQSPALRIDNIYPNPFRDEVKIAFDAQTGDELTASIFNLKGQRVYQTSLSGNIRNFSWDARGEIVKVCPREYIPKSSCRRSKRYGTATYAKIKERRRKTLDKISLY